MGVAQKEEDQLCGTECTADHLAAIDSDVDSVKTALARRRDYNAATTATASAAGRSLDHAKTVYTSQAFGFYRLPEPTTRQQYDNQVDQCNNNHNSSSGKQRQAAASGHVTNLVKPIAANQGSAVNGTHKLSDHGDTAEFSDGVPLATSAGAGSADGSDKAERTWYLRLADKRHVQVRELGGDQLRGRCRCMQPVGIQVGEGRYALPRSAISYIGRYATPNYVVPGQVLVCTVPKSGTTWTLEMAWLLTHNCDFDGARCALDNNRTEDMGSTLYFSPCTDFFAEYVPHALVRPSTWLGLLRLLRAYIKPLYRRETVVKTHLPLSIFRADLLDTNKVIYVARNPKDAIVSYYHHFTTCRAVKYEGSLDDLAIDYMAGLLPGLPFFSHVLEAWRLRHHPNLLFLFYEEMRADLPATLQRVSEFLGTPISEKQLAQLTEHLSFDNMKRNRYANTLLYQDAGIMHMANFIREGRVGSWRQKISDKVNRKLDQWIEESTRGTGLSFKGL